MIGDRARASTYVATPPERAFDVFTRETDLWWRRGPRYRFGGKRRGTLTFEPGQGGRLFEAFDEGHASVVEVGKVLVWEPGARLVFEWILPNFKAGERTEVEVRFESSGEGTNVTIEHRGWAALRRDHPARHGKSEVGTIEMVGLFWGELLVSMRLHAVSD